MTMARPRRRQLRRIRWWRRRLAVEAAESGTSDADDALAEAGEQFCGDAEGYVEALDRYGKLFTDDAATVGDVNTAGADLVEPRGTVAAAIEDLDSAKAASVEAEQELIDAQAALAEAIATRVQRPGQLDRAADSDDHDDRRVNRDRAGRTGRS